MFKLWESLGRDFQETLKKLLRDYTEALLLAIVMALILRWTVFGSYRIGDVAMLPSVFSGDFVLGYKLPFFGSKRSYRRFDVVIFKCESGLCLQRIVGLPGDRVEMKSGHLLVNDIPASYQLLNGFEHIESWAGSTHSVLLPQLGGLDLAPEVVMPGELLLVSDERMMQEGKSGSIRRITSDRLQAKALGIWLSWDPVEDRIRWNRVGLGLY